MSAIILSQIFSTLDRQHLRWPPGFPFYLLTSFQRITILAMSQVGTFSECSSLSAVAPKSADVDGKFPFSLAWSEKDGALKPNKE